MPDPESTTYIAVTESQVPALIEVLTSCRWEFFGTPVHTEASVRESWARGDFSGPDSAGYLIQSAGAVIGLVRLHDLEDETPVFDVRLVESVRGRGHGRRAVEWVNECFFGEQGRSKVFAHTRADNLAMRRTLHRCGYVKEGHYRAAEQGGLDWLGYSLLRRDWDSGSTTPVPWDGQP